MEFHITNPGWSRNSLALQLSYAKKTGGGDSFASCRTFCGLVADSNYAIPYRGFDLSSSGTCYCRFDSRPSCPAGLNDCSTAGGAGYGFGPITAGAGDPSVKFYPTIECPTTSQPVRAM